MPIQSSDDFLPNETFKLDYLKKLDLFQNRLLHSFTQLLKLSYKQTVTKFL